MAHIKLTELVLFVYKYNRNCNVSRNIGKYETTPAQPQQNPKP